VQSLELFADKHKYVKKAFGTEMLDESPSKLKYMSVDYQDEQWIKRFVGLSFFQGLVPTGTTPSSYRISISPNLLRCCIAEKIVQCHKQWISFTSASSLSTFNSNSHRCSQTEFI
jgi:hypothetical protein